MGAGVVLGYLVLGRDLRRRLYPGETVLTLEAAPGREVSTVRNQVLRSLGHDDREALRRWTSRVYLQPGAILYETGQDIQTVYFPINAVLSEVCVMEDGRSVESASIGYESAAGLMPALCEETSSTRVFTQIPGHSLRVPAHRLRELVQKNAEIWPVLMRHVHASHHQAEQAAACNALHDVQNRLCRWLLMSQDRVGSDCLPLTQEYLSIMLGVRRTTITKAAQLLKAESAIRYSRGQIIIKDRTMLEQQACECYKSLVERNEKRVVYSEG